MCYSVIFLLVCRKEHFQRDDMHVIITLTQSPKAVRHTVYGADNIFILVKRSLFCGAVFNLIPELLCELSTGSYIKIRIYSLLFLVGKVKDYIACLDVMITKPERCLPPVEILHIRS